MQNGPAPDDILAFIRSSCGKVPDVAGRADLFAALALDGDRAEAFMQAFAAEFGVDLTGYEPAYHSQTKGRAWRLGWPIPVPHQFGVRIPIALSHLVAAAQSGAWAMRYPNLTPRPSHDWLNAVLVLGGLPLVVAGLVFLIRLV